MKGNAAIHYLKYQMGLEKPQTQTTEKERLAISKYASDALLGVEIGVFEGVNTIAISNAMPPNGKLFGIDPFFKGRFGVCYHEQIARNGIAKNKLKHKVELLRMFSFDAVDKVPNELDFIFIDGDHSYEGFIRDWNDWSPKLKSNGIIALHDTAVPLHDNTVSQLGSYKYFQENIKNDKKFELIETVDSLSVMRKASQL